MSAGAGQPNPFGIVVCPDCNRAFGEDGHLVHDKTCPLGLGYDEIQADDRAWFEQHPGATTRRRPVHWAEAADLRMMGMFPPFGDVVGEVVVTELAPGVRTKSFANVVCLIGGAS